MINMPTLTSRQLPAPSPMKYSRLLGLAAAMCLDDAADAFSISHVPSTLTSTRRGRLYQRRPNQALEEKRYGRLSRLLSSAKGSTEATLGGGKDVDDGEDDAHLSGMPCGGGKDVDDGEDDAYLSGMPWGDLQSFALHDNLPKYVVVIPIPGKKDKYGTFALWRSLIKDSVELAGYEVDYVRRRYEADVKTREDWKGYRIGDGGDSMEFGTAPGELPLLESFEFHPDGGVSGLSYGLPGIADGVSIRTTAVTDIEKTVIMGYVRTADGSAAYELGSPAGSIYSEDMRQNMLENVARTAGTLMRSGVPPAVVPASAGGGSDAMDSNLVNLAGTTAMLLAAASAVGMLSHHLTVNVFWV